ncbi:hypothetical protein GCM10008949_20430 [Deinococcus humi]|nr:hypothetical protein GCM10008949_20430 [Deinococcus humi]
MEQVPQAELGTLAVCGLGLECAAGLGGFLAQGLGVLLGELKVEMHGGFLGALAAAAASLGPALMNLWCARQGSGHILRVAHSRCANWPTALSSLCGRQSVGKPLPLLLHEVPGMGALYRTRFLNASKEASRR